MKTVGFKQAKNFKEILNDTNSFYEIFIVSGRSVRRALIKRCLIRDECGQKTFVLNTYTKYGVHSAIYYLYIDDNTDINSDEIVYYNTHYILTRNNASSYLMKKYREEISKLKQSAYKAQEKIYVL